MPYYRYDCRDCCSKNKENQENTNDKHQLKIFCHGYCKNEGEPTANSSIGIYCLNRSNELLEKPVIHSLRHNDFSEHISSHTKKTAELLAMLLAIRKGKMFLKSGNSKIKKVSVFVDSFYSLGCIFDRYSFEYDGVFGICVQDEHQDLITEIMNEINDGFELQGGFLVFYNCIESEEYCCKNISAARKLAAAGISERGFTVNIGKDLSKKIFGQEMKIVT